MESITASPHNYMGITGQTILHRLLLYHTDASPSTH